MMQVSVDPSSSSMRRAEILAKYQLRIHEGAQTKLKGEEQVFLIQSFIHDLKGLKTESTIKARCEAEIRLLEQGYPQATIGKTKLNRYRSAIQKAVEEGTLKLTQTNSKWYTYEKKQGTEKTGAVGQAHHHFAWLYMCYDNATYRSFEP